MYNQDFINTKNMTLGISICLLGFLFFCDLIIGATLLVGIPVNPIQSPLAFICAALVTYYFLRKSSVLPILLSLLFIAVTAWLNSLYYDNSYDSIIYHYETVVMLANGWNPIREFAPDGVIWCQHYAKGLELAQNAILSLTGNLQSVKCVNFILFASSLTLMWHALKTCVPNINTTNRWIIIIVTAVNPVCISQITSGYNDYALWPETILLLSSFALAWKFPKHFLPYALIFMVIAFGINTKFTHFLYIGLACIIFAIWCIIFKKQQVLKYGTLATLAGIIIGVCVIGFNPYITNTIDYKNPVYPLGTDKVDIMTNNTPEMFKVDNRAVNFVKSLTSIGENPYTILKCKIGGNNIRGSYGYDARVNGFGILMIFLLGLALLLMIGARPSIKWWIVYLLIYASCILFEQSWWARYIPFLWLAIVVPMILYCQSSHKHKWGKTIYWCLFGLSLINGSISILETYLQRSSYTKFMNYALNPSKSKEYKLKAYDLTNVLRQQLKETGVNYIEVKSISDIDISRAYLLVETDEFTPVIELPESRYPEIYQPQPMVMGRPTQYPCKLLNKIHP